jgi:hypothetical protein
VVLDEKRREADLISLGWIEESIERIRLFHREPRGLKYLEDFQALDFDLFRAAIEFHSTGVNG